MSAKCDTPAGLHVSFWCKCCISMHHQHVKTRRHYSLFCLSTYWYHKCFAQLAGSSLFVINTCLSLGDWHYSSGLSKVTQIQVNTHEKSYYLITKFKTEKPNCIYIWLSKLLISTKAIKTKIITFWHICTLHL